MSILRKVTPKISGHVTKGDSTRILTDDELRTADHGICTECGSKMNIESDYRDLKIYKCGCGAEISVTHHD